MENNKTEQIAKSLILIVDDNYKNLQLLGNVLRQENYEIAVSTTGLQALKTVKEVNPDLILLDVMMPEMNGYEVCKILKNDVLTTDIPIIFLTAKTAAEEIVMGLSLGAVDYITKPFNNAELLMRVKTHIELKNSKEELKRINATKDKFFSIIAHDLKNPFITMLGFSSMLISDYYEFTDEERLDYLAEMEKVAKKSHQLLENLLQWSRSQTGRMEFNPKEKDITLIVFETITLLESQAKAKNITLVNNAAYNMIAYFDEDMITTVFRNLCSNAIKFTYEGGHVQVDYIDEGDFYQIIISDDGVGMDEKTMNALFKIEVQQTKTGTGNEIGTGLGLILCKEFVEKNNGKIWVTSHLGSGSSFHFTIPKYKNGKN
ncbi:MAG: hybrid sensor histidine kinase/response regulator [bacterium]